MQVFLKNNRHIKHENWSHYLLAVIYNSVIKLPYYFVKNCLWYFYTSNISSSHLSVLEAFQVPPPSLLVQKIFRSPPPSRNLWTLPKTKQLCTLLLKFFEFHNQFALLTMCKPMQEKVRKKRWKVLLPNKTSDTELNKNTANKTDIHITVTFRQLLLGALAKERPRGVRHGNLAFVCCLHTKNSVCVRVFKFAHKKFSLRHRLCFYVRSQNIKFAFVF